MIALCGICVAHPSYSLRIETDRQNWTEKWFKLFAKGKNIIEPVVYSN